MSLLLVDSSDLFFRVTDRTVVLLWILLYQLVLKELLVLLEFLSVIGDTRLTRIDRSLHGCDHIEEVGIILRVSNVIEPWVLQSLLSSDSLGRIHLEETTH